MRPTQLCRQRRHNLQLIKALVELHHAKQVAAPVTRAVIQHQSVSELLHGGIAIVCPSLGDEALLDGAANVPIRQHQRLVHLGQHLGACTLHQLPDVEVQRIGVGASRCCRGSADGRNRSFGSGHGGLLVVGRAAGECGRRCDLHRALTSMPTKPAARHRHISVGVTPATACRFCRDQHTLKGMRQRGKSLIFNN